jgi:hypothetical protein
MRNSGELKGVTLGLGQRHADDLDREGMEFRSINRDRDTDSYWSAGATKRLHFVDRRFGRLSGGEDEQHRGKHGTDKYSSTVAGSTACMMWPPGSGWVGCRSRSHCVDGRRRAARGDETAAQRFRRMAELPVNKKGETNMPAKVAKIPNHKNTRPRTAEKSKAK